MKDYTEQYPGRKWTKLYYADTEGVHEVQAFMCPPNDEETRWVPEFGFSTSIGHSLQRTPEGAREERGKLLVTRAVELKAALKRIQAHLREAGITE